MTTTERDPIQPEPSAGAELAGRYRLEAPLGEGGMGVVWAGTQLTTGKPVAIKILKSRDPGDAARFLREARVAAQLLHRNIVQVFDFWEVEGGGPVFMVMELLRGETFSAMTARAPGGRLSLAEALPLLLPVAHAIRAAHAQGVVHRDLKPENIFLARTLPTDPIEVKVLDFGLAKPLVSDVHATALTQTGSVMGTPFYMAPEQVYGEKTIDARADVWAFGVVLYEALSGQRPFNGENYGQVFRQIASGRYRPIRELVPELPPIVDEILARVLVHDREGRAGDLAEVAAALAGAASASHHPPLPTTRLPSQAPPPEVSGQTVAIPGANTPPGFQRTPPAPSPTMLAAATSVKAPAANNKLVLGMIIAGAAAMLATITTVVVMLVALSPSKTHASDPMPPLPVVPAASPLPTAPVSVAVTPPPPADPAPPPATPPSAAAPTKSAAASVSATPPRARPTPQKAKDPLSGGRF